MRYRYWLMGVMWGASAGWLEAGYVLNTGLDVQKATTQRVLESGEGLGVFVINLVDSADRWARIQPRLRNFEVHRVEAVAGDRLKAQDLRDMVDEYAYQRYMGKWPGRGTIGCYLSHVKAWKTFLASPYAYGLICEDDIAFNPDHLQLILRDLVQVSHLWDICSFQLQHRGCPLTMATLSKGYRLCVYLLPVTGAGAYVINRRAAHKLVAKAFPLKMPNDHYFTRTWEFGLSFTGIEPRLVTPEEGSSDIEKMGRHARQRLGWVAAFSRGLFVVQTAIIHLFYNLGMYVYLKMKG